MVGDTVLKSIVSLTLSLLLLVVPKFDEVRASLRYIPDIEEK